MDEKYLYLNLQEQVGKNKHDIEELRTVKFNLERAGVRVVGEEANASDLPDPITYTGQLGDAYLIGTEAPYDMYIYTQPSVGETNFKWFNIGAFPALGPQGEVGPEGPQGPQGDASNWRFGTVNPSILDKDREHDGYLNTTTGMVFEFSGTNWVPIGSIQGPRGIQGPIGPQGPTGATGAQGNQGPQGPAGITIEIIGVVDTLGSLPDPSTVSRNAGYILESGDDKNLYIIVEDENQDLTWYDAGAFTGVPGTAAGFGIISATTTTKPAGYPASVSLSISGPDTAKNITFNFGIPAGAELENVNQENVPSTEKGYTQWVINQRTPERVIKALSFLGLTAPVTTQQIIAALQSNFKNTIVLLSNNTNFETILDAPKAKGQLIITEGTAARNYDVRYIDDSYNVYIYDGAAGTPATAIWQRLLTTKDAAGIGTPAGGTEGQILAKKSDDDFDTEWEDVPNAPNGVADGGATGQMLIKKTATDYDTEWVTPPTGVPDGGATGQMLVKQSNADGDAAWQTPPVGLPSSGSTGQILQKKSGTNFDVEWAAKPVGLPSGGTSGQVLQKASGTDYDVEWATPSGGGGGISSYGKNLIINPFFDINQRNASGTISAAQYTVDRWHHPNDGGNVYISSGSFSTYNSKVQQAIEINSKLSGGKFIVGFTYYTASSSNATLSIKNSAGNAVALDASKTVTKTIGTTDVRQFIGILDADTLRGSSYDKTTQFWFIMDGSSLGEVYYQNAFCYLVDSATLSDLPSSPIQVAPINYAEEFEKCLYYFEAVELYGMVPLRQISSPYSGVYIKFVSKAHKKRVTPTKSSQNLYADLYNSGSTASGTGWSWSSGFDESAFSIDGAIRYATNKTGTDYNMAYLRLTLRGDAEIYP